MKAQQLPWLSSALQAVTLSQCVPQEDDVGYVQIGVFESEAPTEFATSIQELEKIIQLVTRSSDSMGSGSMSGLEYSLADFLH